MEPHEVVVPADLRYWVVYDAITGEISQSANGSFDQFSIQTAPSGYAIAETQELVPISYPMKYKIDLSGPPQIVARDETVGEARVLKNQELRTKCDKVIAGSFQSNALGSANWYGAKTTDQANMSRVAVVGGDLACSTDPAAPIWPPTTHTAAQGAQVFFDFGAACDAARANLATKKAAVAAALTVDDVNAITWS